MNGSARPTCSPSIGRSTSSLERRPGRFAFVCTRQTRTCLPTTSGPAKRIGNAYEALNRMPPHPNIVGARDFFATEAEDGYVLVTEDVLGQALRLHIEKPSQALTLDQKLHVAKGLLSALEHAHRYGVIHRNLSPSCILLGTDGFLRLTGFDFARSERTGPHVGSGYRR